MKQQKPLKNLAKWARKATLAVVAVLSFAAMPVMAEEPIRIGLLMAATGPASYIGAPIKNAAELLIDQVNQEGGVDGHQLELVAYDTAGNPERARTMMQRLLVQDRVSVVAGPTLTANSLAIESLAARHGVPMVSIAGSHVVATPVRKWVFGSTESDWLVARRTYDYMNKIGISKVALLSSSSGYGRASRETYFKVAKEVNGIEVVMSETYAKGDPDLTAQLIRIRGNEDVQAIILLDVGNEPAIVARNHAALGIDIPMYSSHGQAAFEFPRLAGPPADGWRLPAPSVLVAEQLPLGLKARELSLTFRKLYVDRYDQLPNSFAGWGWDALLVVVDAIRRAGSGDPSAIREAIEQTSGLVGVTRDDYSFGPDNHGGMYDESYQRMVEIRDGGFVLIE